MSAPTQAPGNLITLAGGIFLLMLPVTAVVPLLNELTAGRFPGLSDWQQHLFMSVNLGGALLAGLTVGPWSDRLGRRKPLLVPALCLYALALLAMFMPWPWPVQLALRLVEGYAHMAALLLAMTLAADSVSTRRDGRVMGLVGAAMSLGVACGAVLGGQIDPSRPELVFAWGGALILIVAAVAALLVADAHGPVSTRRLREVIALTVRNRELLVPYAFTFIDRITVGFIISTVSLYFATELGLAPARIGLVMAAFLLPYSLLTFPVGVLSERLDAGLIMATGSIFYGLFLAALGLVGAGQIVAAMVIGGLIASLLLAPSLILVVRLARDDQRATAMGGFHLVGSLGFMLGPLVGVGTVQALRALDLTPYPGVFFIVGALEVLCALLLLPVILRIRTTGHPENT